MATTIHDVAKAAGVSSMTVSNVLNGHPHVRSVTRDKVLAAIASLDYRVNPAARRLRSGPTGTIGLAVPDISQPYFSVLAGHVIHAAEKRDLRVTIEQTNATADEELEAVALSRRLMIDGLILSALALSLPELRRIDYPLVFIGERQLDEDLPQIAMSNTDGSRAAVDHLLLTGARKIALLGGATPDQGMASARLEGYVVAHQAAGMEPDPRLRIVAAGYGMEGGAAAARELIASGVQFDAIFCMTDALALGAVHALVQAGVSIPDQVQVMGFDDIPFAQFSNPSLSTVRSDHALMADTAVELLTSQIRGDKPANGRITSPFQVVIRDSTRRLPTIRGVT